MGTLHPHPNPYGRFLWRMLPVVLLPLVLLLLVFPLARHRQMPSLSAPVLACAPDYLVCLHRTDIIYPQTITPPQPPIALFERRPMRITAYCPCRKCCSKYSGATACGHKIRRSDAFVAAPSNISFGTKIIIPGYNNDLPVQVLDRTSKPGSDCLDVFFNDHQAALNWGVRNLTVTFEKPAGSIDPKP